MFLEQRKYEERLYWQTEGRFLHDEEKALTDNGWRRLDIFHDAELIQIVGDPVVFVAPEKRGEVVLVMTRVTAQ